MRREAVGLLYEKTRGCDGAVELTLAHLLLAMSYRRVGCVNADLLYSPGEVLHAD